MWDFGNLIVQRLWCNLGDTKCMKDLEPYLQVLEDEGHFFLNCKIKDAWERLLSTCISNGRKNNAYFHVQVCLA